MGVKKRLELTESQLALRDLLCTRPVWLTALSFTQLMELTVYFYSAWWRMLVQPVGLLNDLLCR